MPARIRDAIAVGVLLVAGLSAVLAWHPLGRWVAFSIALVGVLIAAGVYRVRRPAIPVGDLRAPLPLPLPAGIDEAVSTPRPAAAPHGSSSAG
jgi:hypothetical protein